MRLGVAVLLFLPLAAVGCSSGGSSQSAAPPAQPPTANAGGPYSGTAGTAVSFSGSGSSDPQGQALTYAWNFGDSGTGTGVNPSHTYAAAGAYTVSLTVTDTSGLTGSATSKATIAVAPLAGVAISGTVSSGTQAISGAHVYLFAAGTAGYGTPSVSLLSAANTGTSDTVGAYVATSATGAFNLATDYTCTSGQQLYLYALGGNAGAGVNTASGLLAALGPCPAAATTVTVNEVTTIAAAYALAGFATDATHVSSSGTALAQVGVANAFANAGNLATLATGVALATTPAGNGTVPQQVINTLANILAGCVNSSGSSSAGCAGLFSNALANGTSGAAPADTATAAINIAHNPAANATTLNTLASSSTSVFAPATNFGYKDFTIVLQFTGAGLHLTNSGSITQGQALGLAVDGLGNVWVQEGIYLGKFSSLGAGALSSTFANSASPIAGRTIAVDPSNNVWVVTSNAIYEVSNAGTPISPLTGYATVGNSSSPPQVYTSLAIDGAGNAWAGQVSGNVTEVSNGGTLLSPSGGYVTGATVVAGSYSPSLAIDGAGNVLLSSEMTANNQPVKLSSSGAVLPSTGDLGCGIGQLAIDSAQRVWGAGFSTTVCGTTSTGSRANYGVGGTYAELADVAVDGAGNVWSPNGGACIPA